jgi:hypothetical protein
MVRSRAARSSPLSSMCPRWQCVSQYIIDPPFPIGYYITQRRGVELVDTRDLKSWLGDGP